MPIFVPALWCDRYLHSMNRSKEQEQLDRDVATRFFEFHWVQWNERALAGSPLHTAGRFLVPRDDMMAHLFEDAPETAPLHDHALGMVPEYSGNETCAFRVAERSTLFSAGGAILFREGDRNWVVEVGGRGFSSPRLPEVICRASLEWAGVATAGGS